MEIRDFGRRVLTDAFDIKEKLKEQHYIELCDLIKEIYDHSEFEFSHKIRVEYSTTIFLASNWWSDHFSGIDYDYNMDDGEPEMVEISDIFEVSVNLKEEYNKICTLDILDIMEIKNTIFKIASKEDTNKIYYNKTLETQHETNVSYYTNSLESIYDSEGISRIVRSVKKI
tara:strand:+ start:436 stop:948 length:513 start_codon:yes stop_codon:yes gene_type:complete